MNYSFHPLDRPSPIKVHLRALEMQRIFALAVAMGRKYENSGDDWKSGKSNGTSRIRDHWGACVPPHALTFVPGLMGELAFSLYSGVPLDEKVYTSGSSMQDFYWDDMIIEVKTSTGVRDLLVKDDRIGSATHFVASLVTSANVVQLVGYALRPPTREGGSGWRHVRSFYGWTNYAIEHSMTDPLPIDDRDRQALIQRVKETL